MRKSGFTLIELLVVMAIIGILAGLVFPTLGGVRKRAFRTQTHNLVSQVDAAWHVHFNDFRSFPNPKYFEDAESEDDDTLFPMTPQNLCILNWRTPRPNGYDGSTEKWMDNLVKAVKEATSKKSANKPRKITVDKKYPIATRDAYLELDQIQWIVGLVNLWGRRAAQKGFEKDGVAGAKAAIKSNDRIWAKLDTGYNGKLHVPGSSQVEGEEEDPTSIINKPAVAWGFTDRGETVGSW